MGLKGNKGEWSEVYVLLKSLSDGKLFAGDKNTNTINQLFYPIIRIIRDQTNETVQYCIKDNLVFVNANGSRVCSITLDEFANKASILLNSIKKGNKTFEVPEIEILLSQIKCNALKAKSTSKSDICIVIHDLRTGLMPKLGFSIKSQLGSPSTLLNAGKTTNFIYKIEGKMDDKQVSIINKISTRQKIRDRIQAIFKNNCNLKFIRTERDTFGNNLILIDSMLPKIISESLLKFYKENISKLDEIVANLEQENPISFNQSADHEFYSYKIKRFLTDTALGMMPATAWSGQYDATGGYLVVKEDGEIICYHIYNRNELENYLLFNTKLETASSTRHDFGNIYKEEGSLFIKLNLQIRFIK